MFLGDMGKDAEEKASKKNPVKGENIDTEIRVSLEDAFYGLEKKISLRTVEGKMKTFEVKIPEGIRNGEKIRLIGQGKKGVNGGKNGDLLIKINIEDNKIYGYAYASTFKGRPAYDWSVETSIYVKCNFSRNKVGTLLYNELERYLKLQNIINVNACITYPNEKSENFHKKFGYKTVGHFTKCGYKFGQWHDMFWMEKFLGEHSIPPRDAIPFSALNLK